MALDFVIGDAVLVGTTKEPGVVRYIGLTQFSTGEWVGVELEKDVGKNSGVVKDVKYFDCKENHGIFVRKTSLAKMHSEKKEKESPRAAGTAKQKHSSAHRVKSLTQRGTDETSGAGEVAMMNSKSTKSTDSEVPFGDAASMGPSSSTKKIPIQTTSSVGMDRERKGKAKPSGQSRNAAQPCEADDATVPNGQTSALADLKRCVEERNVENLSRAISAAEIAGAPADEILAAHRILSFESQKVLTEYIGQVRELVANLVQSINGIAERVRAIEAQGAESADWVTDLVQRLDVSVWDALNQKIEDRIQVVARTVANDMISLLPSAERSASEKQAQATTSTNDHLPPPSSGDVEHNQNTGLHAQTKERSSSTDDRQDQPRKTAFSSDSLDGPAARNSERTIDKMKLSTLCRQAQAGLRAAYSKGKLEKVILDGVNKGVSA